MQNLAWQLRAPAWATCAAGAAQPQPARAPLRYRPCRAAHRRTPPPLQGTRWPPRRAAVRRAQALRQQPLRSQASKVWAAGPATGQHIKQGRGTWAAAARSRRCKRLKLSQLQSTGAYRVAKDLEPEVQNLSNCATQVFLQAATSLCPSSWYALPDPKPTWWQREPCLHLVRRAPPRRSRAAGWSGSQRPACVARSHRGAPAGPWCSEACTQRKLGPPTHAPAQAAMHAYAPGLRSKRIFPSTGALSVF